MVSQWGYSGQSCHALTTWRNGNEKWHVRLSEAKQQILQVSGMIAADPVSKSQPNFLTFQFCYTDLHCGQPAHTSCCGNTVRILWPELPCSVWSVTTWSSSAHCSQDKWSGSNGLTIATDPVRTIWQVLLPNHPKHVFQWPPCGLGFPVTVSLL